MGIGTDGGGGAVGARRPLDFRMADRPCEPTLVRDRLAMKPSFGELSKNRTAGSSRVASLLFSQDILPPDRVPNESLSETQDMSRCFDGDISVQWSP